MTSYCIRCGKALQKHEAYYSKNDPDHEESMCQSCYERYEKAVESEENMPANVETMFYVRKKRWHGLGIEVQEAPTSADALVCAGLDREVIQKNVYTEGGTLLRRDLY